MRVKAAGKRATMVLLNAGASSVRVVDALNIRRHVLGDAAPVSASASAAPRIRASVGGTRERASASERRHARLHRVAAALRHPVATLRHRRHRHAE